MRGEASVLDSCDCSAAFCARSLTRSAFAESSARLSRKTPTFTNTTPASIIPLTAIQRIPPLARLRERTRARALGFRLTVGCAATLDWASATLANLGPHPEPGRLRTRVPRDLAGRRPDRPARCGPHGRSRSADAHREVGRARAAALRVAQELLDDPVLERVERDHPEPAIRAQQLQRCGQGPFERAELVVDLDPERLEHALRRMPLAETRGSRNRALDRLHELTGALEGMRRTLLD